MTAAEQDADAEAQRQKYRDVLVQSAGGYLRNVVRTPQVSCSVCATFVEPQYDTCHRCKVHRDRHGDRLADLVVPLTYGVKDAQSGHMMRRYKAPVPGDANSWVRLTLTSGLLTHGRCVTKVIGARYGTRLTVPSLSTSRVGVHPLTQITTKLGLTNADLVLQPVEGAIKSTEARTGVFTVSDPSKVAGRHVMIIDDTWASGGSAQSAALRYGTQGRSSSRSLLLPGG